MLTSNCQVILILPPFSLKALRRNVVANWGHVSITHPPCSIRQDRGEDMMTKISPTENQPARQPASKAGEVASDTLDEQSFRQELEVMLSAGGSIEDGEEGEQKTAGQSGAGREEEMGS